MKRFWISWIQNSEDFRPLSDPPSENVLGWWCSGYDADDSAVLCAAVLAIDEDAARAVITANWESKPGEVGEWRFCEERASDWTPGNRFPITTDWAKKRFAQPA